MINQRKSDEVLAKGFTLLELLIVIAILAILATAVVLVLNPAQYLAQSRDTQRMNDLDTVKNAINLYLATATSVSWTPVTSCDLSAVASCTNPPTGWTIGSASTSTAINGTGWINVPFNALPNGSPLSKLPLDPVNGISGGVTYYYGYKSSASQTFKLVGKLESSKYSPLMSTDGGTDNNWYEVGTDMSL